MSLFSYQGKAQALPRSFKAPGGAVLPLRKHFAQGLVTVESLVDYGFTVYVAPAPVDPTVEQRVLQLDQSCRAHIDASAHWTAGPMIFDKAKENKPKSKAIKDWADQCWLVFFTRRGQLLGGDPWSDDLLVFPDFPAGVTIQEAMIE